jgi:hypothetical protein
MSSSQVIRPGLLIVGVGRSGTSIATKLVTELGLTAPRDDDLIPGNYANPRGYWESQSLVDLNDRLLEQWCSSWWQPPPAVTTSMLDELGDVTAEAADVFTAVFPGGSAWTWKDPRLTVLLPFWDRVLGNQPVLFLYREPQSVARSIAKRDGLTYEQGLSVWERHTRLALTALSGKRVAVSSYADLCADPARYQASLLAFCRAAGLAVHEPAQFPEDLLSVPHSSCDGPLTDEQSATLAILETAKGLHERFSVPELPNESPSANDVLSLVIIPGWKTVRDLETAAKRMETERAAYLQDHARIVVERERLLSEHALAHAEAQRLTGENAALRAERAELQDRLREVKASLESTTADRDRVLLLLLETEQELARQTSLPVAKTPSS